VPSSARWSCESLVASATPSPSAVPSLGRSSCSAASVTDRSSVGGDEITARVPIATIATRKRSGIRDRKLVAAARAATIREGSTSFASIEREMSTASTMVASSRLVVTVASGRATPTSIAARAASSTASGSSRRARGGRGAIPGSSGALAKRRVTRLRRRSRA
jgi:hypothetical protein